MLLAQFSPGPDMLLLVRNSLAHPLRAGLWTVGGIVAGLAVHLSAVLTGLALAVRESRVLYPALLFAGGAWLTWLGWRLVRARQQQAEAEAGSQRLPLSARAAFAQGFLTNLTNAKAILFLATVVISWLGITPSWERKTAAAAIILGQALLFWSLFVIALQHPLVRGGWKRAARPLNLLFGLAIGLLGLNAVREAVIQFTG